MLNGIAHYLLDERPETTDRNVLFTIVSSNLDTMTVYPWPVFFKIPENAGLIHTGGDEKMLASAGRRTGIWSLFHFRQ